MFFRLRDARFDRRRLPRSAAAVNISRIVSFRRHYLGLILLCFAGLAAASSAAIAAPTVTLVNPTVRLDSGQSEGEVQMVLQLNGLDADQAQDQKLLNETDVVSQDSWPFKFVGGQPMGSPGPTSATWHVRLQLGGLPANSTQTRYLSVTIAGASTALEYTLTNKPTESFSWTIKAPPTIAIGPNQDIPVSITVGPVPAHNVKLVGPYLPEKKTSALIASHGLTLLCDCKHEADKNADNNIDLPAHSTTQFWLRGADGVGQYDGSVTIVCNEKPEGDAVALSILSTTGVRQSFGVAVFFVSALLTWFVTVFARNLFNRDQMLLPVPRLRARLANVQTQVEDHRPAGVDTPHFIATITRLLGQLDETQLVALGLPGKIPSPWTPSPPSNQADAYRNALQGIADWLAVLETIYGDGFAVIWPKLAGATQAQRQAIIDATTALDQLLVPLTAPPLDGVRQTIFSKVNVVMGAIAPMGGGAPAAPAARSYDQLSMQIAQISTAVWLVVLLGTTVVGSMALVLNSSFGSLMDFAMCVAWGLGLPIGSQALTASFGTVGTSLGMSMQR